MREKAGRGNERERGHGREGEGGESMYMWGMDWIESTLCMFDGNYLMICWGSGCVVSQMQTVVRFNWTDMR